MSAWARAAPRRALRAGPKPYPFLRQSNRKQDCKHSLGGFRICRCK